MRNLKYRMVLFLIAVSPIIASGQSENKNSEKGFNYLWKKHVRTRMVSQLSTAYEFDNHSFQMVKLAVKPEFKVKFHKNLRFTGILRFYGEFLDKLEPGRPAQDAISKASKRQPIGDRLEVELREFYLDWNIGKKSALRLGKQQIVWGETDGLKLLDVVNPQNFREFMLEELEDSRIPLWAAKAEFPIHELDVELVWIPDMTYHDLPDFAAPFFPIAFMPSLPEGVSLNMLDADKPNRIITDADFGVKASAFIKGWDLTLNYLYHYDDLPVLLRHFDQDSNGDLAIRMQPQYKRMHTIGGSFNNAIGPITLRGELAFNVNRPFMTTSVDDTDGLVKSDQLMMAVGLDWLFGETMLSVQTFHDILIKDVEAYNRSKYESNVSFFASQELLYDDLKLEVLLVQNLNKGGGMIRPKASYYARSNLKIIFGSDIFYGNQRGLFGQFRDRSRIYMGMEWGL